MGTNVFYATKDSSQNDRINDPKNRINFPSLSPPQVLPEPSPQPFPIAAQRSVKKHLIALFCSLLMCIIVLYARSFDEKSSSVYVNRSIPQIPPPDISPIINLEQEEPKVENSIPIEIHITDPVIGKNYFNILGD